MNIIKADLEAIAANEKGYPKIGLPEIAFAGRSNVGKSSLLNLITKRKSLARVSTTPGKTRTINFYNLDDKLRIVDLPGYGYAKVSKTESKKWAKMIEDYLIYRETLIKVALLVDIRHNPTEDDVQMYEFLKYYNLDGLVIATKSDKISRNKISAQMLNIRKMLDMKDNDKLIFASALKKIGIEEILTELFAIGGNYVK